MQELKPCPHCNGEAELQGIENHESTRFGITYITNGCFSVKCKVCKRYDATPELIGCVPFYNKQKAIDAWNNRATVHNGGVYGQNYNSCAR